MKLPKSHSELNKLIIACEKCPRLVNHCKTVALEKRAAYKNEKYWGKPVPNFGTSKAKLLIVGLAPAAHGANRTGRMFTGDRSGEWLYRALHKAGLANKKESLNLKDGLKLKDTVITAVNHCAPPLNKPLKSEIQNCYPFFSQNFEIYPYKVILSLGGIAWKATIDELKKRKLIIGANPKFGHGVVYKIEKNKFLIGSYHPSQQNTFTKRLTEPMFDSVFFKINKLLM